VIPIREIDIDLELSESLEINKTYKVSSDTIQGFTDGTDALKQAIYKVLNTEMYEYGIYSFNYGIELESLIGKDSIYVKIELKRKIEECLMQDDRILSLDNFMFTASDDNLLCEFNVNSIYGKFQINKEVDV